MNSDVIHLTMSPNITELINDYYAAKKPYTQMLQEAHASPSSTEPSPETDKTNETLQSPPEPLFSFSPAIPKDEMKALLQKLEAAKIGHMQGDKARREASGEEKGKASGGKK